MAEISRKLARNFFDVCAFGAVMSTEVNCGQVRGPVQLNFAKSVEPVVPAELSITRMAVTKEQDLEKERTMGRKAIVPYGLYRGEGYISAHLANKTEFDEDDLALLWESLENMFDHDHSAARGKMNGRKLIIFKHESKLGNASAHSLFDRVTVERAKDSKGPARAFKDYSVEINREEGPSGVEIIEKF